MAYQKAVLCDVRDGFELITHLAHVLWQYFACPQNEHEFAHFYLALFNNKKLFFHFENEIDMGIYDAWSLSPENNLFWAWSQGLLPMTMPKTGHYPAVKTVWQMFIRLLMYPTRKVHT